MENNPLSVSDAIALINQTLDYAYPTLVVEGEIASFKINKNRFVFFDIKDETGTLSCFMSLFQLRISLEDGMRVRLTASPKLTAWGKFSLTVREVQPVGQGSLKRAFELLKTKLAGEGLLSPERKRPLPILPAKIGLISSTEAAGYNDFLTILEKRWSGLDVTVANVQVQGATAPDQIIKAIEFFNQSAKMPEVLVIIRGGGSADDLSAFNDELLVRTIAASRIPTLVGVGHEVDVSLADLVADVRAATPSNAAEILVPDKREVISGLKASTTHMINAMNHQLETSQSFTTQLQQQLNKSLDNSFDQLNNRFKQNLAVLKQLDPKSVLKRGYALVRDQSGKLIKTAPKVGELINLEAASYNLKAEVKHVKQP